jgi:tRNA threonylcarbamoyladenosine biosynthesis protein TsaB
VSLRILALDTTSEFGSLAVREEDRLLEEVLLHAPEGFSQVLYEHLGRLLERHRLGPADFDCYASASGPGSFTGVRVGLAAVKGLAEVAGKPVVAVSNLKALAWFGAAPLRAVVLDARRGEVYGAVYNAALEPVVPEVVTRFPLWLASLPEGEIEFVATDFTPFRAALVGTRFESVPVATAPRALAGAIARIAAGEFRAGRAADPASVDANYVRRADAELFWRDPRG